MGAAPAHGSPQPLHRVSLDWDSAVVEGWGGVDEDRAPEHGEEDMLPHEEHGR